MRGPAAVTANAQRRRHRNSRPNSDLDEAAVVAAAADEGVSLAPFSTSSSPRRGRAGLIFGYSSLDERAITDGVARLARAIEAASVR